MGFCVFDCQSVKFLPSGVSREETRAWSEKERANRDARPESNYDFSRSHLNFEVFDGKIVPVQQKSLDQRYRENLARRGIPHPEDAVSHVSRQCVKKERIVAASIIIGGTSEDMNRLAFGSQHVDFSKGADNSHTKREKGIENFYLDAYDFLSREFGKENVVSLIVHCDETGVHGHATIIPTGLVKKKERVSWKNVFGKSKEETSAKFRDLHDRYAETVGKKYGLERGIDIRQTGAKHRTTKEYNQELKAGIAKNEKIIKSMATMVANACSRFGIAVERSDSADAFEQLQFIFGKMKILERNVSEIEKFGKKEKNLVGRFFEGQSMKDSLTKLNLAARECGILRGTKDMELKELVELFQGLQSRLMAAEKQGEKKGAENAINEILSEARVTWKRMPSAKDLGKDYRNAKSEEKRLREFEQKHGQIDEVGKKVKDLTTDVASERERGERAWMNVFRLWPTAENAMKAIIHRTNVSQHLFTDEQARSIWDALRNASDEGERREFANDIIDFSKDFSEGFARCPGTWIAETTQEVMAIATTAWDALTDMFSAASSQTVGSGGGGGNNDLPKKKKDNDTYAGIMGKARCQKKR